MKKTIQGIFLAIALSSYGTVFSKNLLTNCVNGERIFFSCSSKSKVISYCASPIKSSSPYLEYRFGSPNKIELSYKVFGSDLIKKIHRADVLGASSASTAIWFTNNEISYILNDPVKGTPSLEVIENKQTIAKFNCEMNFAGDTSMPLKLIEDESAQEFFRLFEKN
jgi:hypothetical protein